MVMDKLDPIELNIFSSRVSALCDEMGLVLKRAAFSPNIKDRLDYSCAIFDREGEMVAQADHMPVHLGSMSYAMRSIVQDLAWRQGDFLVLNDPYLGGTHLPDVTVITPAYADNDELVGFIVNRAHHVNIGCDTPGSMPISSYLEEEGLIIPPIFVIRNGEVQEGAARFLGIKNAEITGDFAAQIGANRIGEARLGQLIKKMGLENYRDKVKKLNDLAEGISSIAISQLNPGKYEFTDYLDGDGCGAEDLELTVEVTITANSALLDFTKSSDMVKGNLNCPESVVAAASFYCFRCLMPSHTPACHGLFRNIKIKTRQGSILNPRRPAAVAAGNVETSMRLVDLVFGALAKAAPFLVPAAGQGTMNNIAMGLIDKNKKARWDYYETIAGGIGGGPSYPGIDGKHSHMTNTLNTPVESVEMHYPLRIKRYEIRECSGGCGRNRGGDGVVREYEFLDSAVVTILSERRKRGPWGLEGGGNGKPGLNQFNGNVLPSKCTFNTKRGDKVLIMTPGGGGWGN